MASTAEAPPALPGQSGLFYEALRYASWPLLRGAFRLEAHGIENVPAHGGVVLASLHRSNWDTFAVLVPLRRRRGRAMAKVELYRNRLLGRILLAGGAFPVRRGENDTEAIASAIGLLR